MDTALGSRAGSQSPVLSSSLCPGQGSEGPAHPLPTLRFPPLAPPGHVARKLLAPSQQFLSSSRPLPHAQDSHACSLSSNLRAWEPGIA